MPLKKGSAQHVIALASPVNNVEPKSAYELEREANIRRNDHVLATIGLAKPNCETPKTVRKRPRAQMSEAPPRRSLRMFSSLPTTDAAGSSVYREQLSAEEAGWVDTEGSGAPRKQTEGESARRKGGKKQDRGSGSAAASAPREEPEVESESESEGNEEIEEEGGREVSLHRPPSSHEFARLVLKCIRRIPVGSVASYGQLAAMAGLPRNARQVGSMLKEGLCNGGMPWWRVINSAGKISLPRDAGGDLQRRKLEAEGVRFRDNGAVEDSTFWDP